MATPEQLKAVNTKATDMPSRLIESFTGDWEKEWYSYKLDGHWARWTHKLYDPKWKAPAHAKLVLDVRCEQPNTWVVGIDDRVAEVSLKGSNVWQTVEFAPAAFKNADEEGRTDWTLIRELRLLDEETLKQGKMKKNNTRKKVGAPWRGTKPEFRNLRWEE
jgi:hypothetical protein